MGDRDFERQLRGWSLTTAEIMSWVAQATSEVMTFGFHDYQRRLQQSSRHFTRRGWETFTTALNQSKIIDGMTAGKQVLTAQPRSAPILLKEGVFNGRYRWIVKLPVQVTYSGRPLYSFTQEGPGEVTGDGFQDAFGGQQFTWHVVSVGGGGGSPATSSNGGRGFAY